MRLPGCLTVVVECVSRHVVVVAPGTGGDPIHHVLPSSTRKPVTLHAICMVSFDGIDGSSVPPAVV